MTTIGRFHSKKQLAAGMVGLALMFSFTATPTHSAIRGDGYMVKPTGLFPRYPKDSVCPVLSSLYGSMIDVDGSKRKAPHRGVDGGRFGDLIIAPADGRIVAVWETNTGWGMEWSVLISHSADDINSANANVVYLSEFNHLDRNDVGHLKVGARILRGDKIGRVRHPGGDTSHPAETHWEVHKVPASAQQNLIWKKNEFGFDIWWNESAQLVDPLKMLALHQSETASDEVRIAPFTRANDYSDFKGFTYIFECKGPPVKK